MRCRACSVCSVVLQWSKSPAKLITYHLYILMFLKFRYRVHHKVTVTVPFGLALPQSLSEILLSWTNNLPGCSKSIVKLPNGFPTTPTTEKLP